MRVAQKAAEGLMGKGGEGGGGCCKLPPTGSWQSLFGVSGGKTLENGLAF